MRPFSCCGLEPETIKSIRRDIRILHPKSGHTASRRRVSSLAPLAPEIRGLEVETLDLLDCCAQERDPNRPESAFVKRMHDIRRRWSFRNVVVAPPVSGEEILAVDLDTWWLMLGSWMCPTDIFWRVIGPKELTDELRGSNGGIGLGFCRKYTEEELAAAEPLSLFLCPGQIKGTNYQV